MGERIAQWIGLHFGWIQWGFLLAIAFFIVRKWTAPPPSQFGMREADRKNRTPSSKNDLAQARIQKPLALEGIVIEGAPHEVLGVSSTAPKSEIEKAFKEKMNRYHPDKIGPAGSPQWEEAQKIAIALNQARAEMLKRLA